MSFLLLFHLSDYARANKMTLKLNKVLCFCEELGVSPDSIANILCYRQMIYFQ